MSHKRRKNIDFTVESEAMAILDQMKKTPDANVSIPSEAAVKDAKEWVDGNEK